MTGQHTTRMRRSPGEPHVLPVLADELALTRVGRSEEVVRHRAPSAARGTRLLAPGLTLAALALWVVAVRGTRLDRVSDIGLVTALGPAFVPAVVTLSAAFGLTLFGARPWKALLTAQIVLLALMLYGTPAVVEPLARFTTSWLHAGFTEQIARTGQVVPSFDARFSWPGFFSATAWLTRAAGLDSPVVLLKWASFAQTCAYLMALHAITGTVTRRGEVRWLTLWVFTMTSWVGQDYFSPQGLSFFLYLAFVFMVLTWFRSGGRAPTARFGLRDELASLPATPVARQGLVASLLLVAAALVVSHQLTPVILVLAAGLLAVTRTTTLRTLPVVLGVMLAAWIAYGTTSFWTGHLGDMFGGFGHLFESVHENVGRRLTGAPGHLLVLRTRMVLTALVALVAGLGLVRRARAGRGDPTIALLCVAPVPVLALQSYGGEALLRVYLFALPFLSIFFAFAVAPGPTRAVARRVGVLVVLTGVLAPLFLVARYGNERFDMVDPSEHAAIDEVISRAAPGSLLIPVSTALPYGYRRLVQFEYYPSSGPAVLSDPRKAGRLLETGPSAGAYLVITRGQQAYGELSAGLPHGWAWRMAASMLATHRFRVVVSNPSALVLTSVSNTRWEGP